MTGTAHHPLLFLDVDGPLIPFGASQHYPTYRTSAHDDANPLLARINPAHGPRLLALSCELVWATTWMADANECISPRLGLPQLEVMTWPEPSAADERHGLHWKTRALADRAAGRPFIWIDDEITPTDRAWVSAHHPAPALLHRIDPRQGLTDTDYTTLTQWLHGPYPTTS
ncbi:HAD domain-containing protein [Actinocorallia lasiicapitis]